jgi:putative hydrolase of the HAD superfamily
VPIKAVVFDFDGVIVETEEPEYLAWRAIWAEHGQTLALDEWATVIGAAYGPDTFHPIYDLVARTGLDLDEEELQDRKRVLTQQKLTSVAIEDGVEARVRQAREMGLGLAIASSSPRSWIDALLQTLAVADWWPVVACVDDCGVTKPDPAVYRIACERLCVEPGEALAVEDSWAGVLAAKAAGLKCVAVPTRMTAHMDFGEADLIVDSLRALDLSEVIGRLERSR